MSELLKIASAAAEKYAKTRLVKALENNEIDLSGDKQEAFNAKIRALGASSDGIKYRTIGRGVPGKGAEGTFHKVLLDGEGLAGMKIFDRGPRVVHQEELNFLGLGENRFMKGLGKLKPKTLGGPLKERFEYMKANPDIFPKIHGYDASHQVFDSTTHKLRTAPTAFMEYIPNTSRALTPEQIEIFRAKLKGRGNSISVGKGLFRGALPDTFHDAKSHIIVGDLHGGNLGARANGDPVIMDPITTSKRSKSFLQRHKADAIFGSNIADDKKLTRAFRPEEVAGDLLHSKLVLGGVGVLAAGIGIKHWLNRDKDNTKD